MKKTGTHPFPSQEGMVKLRVVGFYVLSCIAVLSLSKEYRLLPRSLVRSRSLLSIALCSLP